MEIVGLVWNEVFIRPTVNALLLLNALIGNFGIVVIIFTLVIRVAMFPLTVRQLRVSRQMAALQPRLRELQARFGQDRERLQQETTRLYRESGVNPLGCAGPLVIQMPIFIALFYGLSTVMPTTPDGLYSLTQHLYSWLSPVFGSVVVGRQFLWLDLAVPDPFPPFQGALLPVLVGLSMYVQQRVTPTPSTSPDQASMTRMMNLMMPLLFGYMTLFFSSGLALYWVTSNVVGVVMQLIYTTMRPAVPLTAAPAATGRPVIPPPPPRPSDAPSTTPRSSRQRKRATDGRSRSKRKKR